jgi:uncharacterized membrane protein YeaQ/YmgE (transglycosylase-associated protein family)
MTVRLPKSHGLSPDLPQQSSKLDQIFSRHGNERRSILLSLRSGTTAGVLQSRSEDNLESVMTGFLWIILVGFVAGIIARILSPGPNNPGGFILTTVLGIGGAFLATFLGQTLGWYRPDQGAGFITATIGALIVLFIWNRLVVRGTIRDQGVPEDPNAPGPRRWL